MRRLAACIGDRRLVASVVVCVGGDVAERIGAGQQAPVCVIGKGAGVLGCAVATGHIAARVGDAGLVASAVVGVGGLVAEGVGLARLVARVVVGVAGRF